jgi:2,3-bisphosphoglycerate-independent phosphoglycerate mutase
MTLLSDGGVHSHINHLKAILALLKTEPELKIYLHAFMDGRDTQKTYGANYIEDILLTGGFEFASMQGRSIGMDRDRRFEKIENAYKMMTGSAQVTNLDPVSYIKSEYAKGLFDEFITPVLFNKAGQIESDDAVFFLNFRPDRARQITIAFCDPHFSEFENKIRPNYFLCMSPYVNEELPEVPILFNREKIKGTLSEYLSGLGRKQFKIAETEKYAHVTYFFNGGEESPFKNEKRVLVNSPKDVATYDLKPQMSAPEVLKKLMEQLEDKSYSLYVVNFANPDMIGHTGNYEAAKQAMVHIDGYLKTLEEYCLNHDITMLLTADHGNVDQMIYPDGSPHTSHTGADVPFVLIKKDIKDVKINSDKALRDVAPTILYLLGEQKNELMTGQTIYE